MKKRKILKKKKSFLSIKIIFIFAIVGVVFFLLTSSVPPYFRLFFLFKKNNFENVPRLNGDTRPVKQTKVPKKIPSYEVYTLLNERQKVGAEGVERGIRLRPPQAVPIFRPKASPTIETSSGVSGEASQEESKKNTQNSSPPWAENFHKESKNIETKNRAHLSADLSSPPKALKHNEAGVEKHTTPNSDTDQSGLQKALLQTLLKAPSRAKSPESLKNPPSAPFGGGKVKNPRPNMARAPRPLSAALKKTKKITILGPFPSLEIAEKKRKLLLQRDNNTLTITIQHNKKYNIYRLIVVKAIHNPEA